MSQKITASNLSYSQNLPPFLARLRGQAGGGARDDPFTRSGGGTPRRKGKPRSGSAEAEDAPVFLDEDGNELDGFRVGADGVAVAVRDSANHPSDDEAVDDGEEKKKKDGGAGDDAAATVAGAFRARRKRKIEGKIVGGGEEDNNNVGNGKEKRRRKDDGRMEEASKEGKDGEKKMKKLGGKGDEPPAAKQKGKDKKKAGKVKLSFGDDGD